MVQKPPSPNHEEASGGEANLRDLEAQLCSRLLASLNAGVVILRMERFPSTPAEVVDVNPAAAELGIRLGNLDPAPIPSGLRPLFEAGHLAIYRDQLDSGTSRKLQEIPKDEKGDVFFDVRSIPLAGGFLGLILEDCTQRVQADRAVLTLRGLSARLHSTLEPQRLLDILIRDAVDMMKTEGGVAAFCTPEGISCFSFLRGGAPLTPEQSAFAGGVFPGRMITLKSPYRTNDPFTDPHVNTALATRLEVGSLISTPIFDDEEMIGFVELYNKAGARGFDQFDEDELAAIAQTATTAMRNSLAYQRLAEAGQMLRRTSERYQVLIEGVDAIVWEADARSWQFTFVSQQAERILGFPVDDWLKNPTFLVDHMHPEDRASSVSYCSTAIDQGLDHQFVFRFIAADGRAVWLQEIVRVVKGSEGNPQCLRGLMLDISERVAVEERLRESELRFRSTFHEAGFGIALVSPKGYPMETNPALHRLLGYEAKELERTDFFTLNHPDDRERDRGLFLELMTGKRDRYTIEKRFLHKEGRVVWSNLIVSAVRDRDGNPEYGIAMIEDITERKSAENEVSGLLARVREDAAELEKRVAERTAQLQETNAELKTFAYTVSHDLRAPLRAVQGFTDILLDEEKAVSSEGRECLQRIMSAVQRMDTLIQDLLAYSKITQQEVMLVPVSLDRVMEEAIRHLQQDTGDREIVIELAPKLPTVLGHHAVLTQVVLNLLSNAVKFVAHGVVPQLRIWAEERGHRIRLFIRDNGIGIPQGEQEKIFMIFERLHSAEEYPGTGVGLAIVRKGVARLGGEIGVESESGKGSTFWIELPAAGVADGAE